MKRKASLPQEFSTEELEENVLQITPLGAGNEVGRSCHILRLKGKTIMLDCGLHPAYNGLAGLPFLDEVDLSTVDICLISHFHLDHAAALPYLMQKTDFKGRVFMTYPTKAIYKWMLADYVKVSNVAIDEMLYDEQDLSKSYDRIEAIDYHQQVEVDGIQFTGYNAGHVLGAAMFLVEIAGVKILYTGDYSREEDRHLMAAELPENIKVDVLICESTYGVQSHEPRLEREHRFTGLVHEIVQRNGRCLLPVFALGRAQELLLILDEYWQRHPSLETIPIYFASSLAKKCMAVYQTYINMMNEKIRREFEKEKNPFIFRHISNLKGMESFEDAGPCVMMASPGMLQSGLSRELFERWCPDKRNGIIITGYSVDGTLAKHILSEPDEIQAMSGSKLPLRMCVEYISFSAHVDYAQNRDFIEQVKAPYLILVHGDANAMGRLKSALESRYKDRSEPIQIFTPKNCETVKLEFRGEKVVKAVGKLAKYQPKESEQVQGVLATRDDFQYQLFSPEDLAEFTGLLRGQVIQRIVIPYRLTLSLLLYHLKCVFGEVELAQKPLTTEHDVFIKEEEEEEKVTEEPTTCYEIFETITLHYKKGLGAVVLEWEGNAMNDMLADGVMAVILAIETSPASVKLTSHSCEHDDHAPEATIKEMDQDEDDHSQDHSHAEEEEKSKATTKKLAQDLTEFLQPHFGRITIQELLVEADKEEVDEMSLTVNAYGKTAILYLPSLNLKCDHAALRERVKTICSRALQTLQYPKFFNSALTPCSFLALPTTTNTSVVAAAATTVGGGSGGGGGGGGSGSVVGDGGEM